MAFSGIPLKGPADTIRNEVNNGPPGTGKIWSVSKSRIFSVESKTPENQEIAGGVTNWNAIK
jgi:hypothetical protein